MTHRSKPPRDWKRSILIFGLGALSWVATYVGMLELIEANMGDLPLVHRVIIGFSVAMLMTMIIWLLDQLFRPQPLHHQALLRRRLHLPVADLDRVRLRLLLEGARKPRRSLPLGRKRRIAGAELAARRRDPPRAAAGDAAATDPGLDRQGRARAHEGNVLPELEARRRPAPQDARGRCAALLVRLRLRQGPHRRGQRRHGCAQRRSRRRSSPPTRRRSIRRPERATSSCARSAASST